MNLALLLMFNPSFKKQAVVIGVAVLLILSMPLMAVFALGQNTLSFWANSSASSDSTNAISATTVGLYQGPAVAGDAYAWGNCTYWVYALRLKAGDPIPITWGNAATWAPRALLEGYVVNHIPSPGAIMQTATVDNGLGHVAYVTAVDSTTGDWTISEMNVKGLDVVDDQTYSPGAASSFDFIHDKAPKS
jgi:surface antigen